MAAHGLSLRFPSHAVRSVGGADPTTPSRRRLNGRLGADFFLGSGALSVVTLPLTPPDLNRPATLGVGLAAVAVGALAWSAPWERWPRAASLWLLVPGFSLIALGNLFGGSDYHTYGIFFVVAFVWVGIAQPPGTSLLVAPFAALAYVVPFFRLPGGFEGAAGSGSGRSQGCSPRCTASCCADSTPRD